MRKCFLLGISFIRFVFTVVALNTCWLVTPTATWWREHEDVTMTTKKINLSCHFDCVSVAAQQPLLLVID